MINKEQEKIIDNIIDTVSRRVYNVSEILSSYEKYNKVMEETIEFFRQGFEVDRLRNMELKYKFNTNGEIYKMQVRHFYYNLCLWSPFIYLGIGDKLDPSYVCDAKNCTAKNRSEFINNFIIEPFKYEVSNRRLNALIAEIISRLSQISREFNPIIGLSINTESFIDLYQRNNEFANLVETELDPSKQPIEWQYELEEKTDRLEQIMRTEENVLKPILLSSSAIKSKQMTECFVSVGSKPDVDGAVMPIPINTNLLKGFKNITNFYLESNSSRKSLLANAFEMGSSGYFAKNLTMLAADVRLDPTVEECNSVNPMSIILKTPKHLNYLKKRWYRTEKDPEYKLLKGNEKHLLGETIYIKSPITCGLDNGRICKKCYGELVWVNEGLNSIGAFNAAKFSEPVSQSILSTKHLLTTDSTELKFTDEFYNFFSINTNEIYLDTAIDYDINRYSLLIRDEDTEIINPNDMDNPLNYYCTKYFVVDRKAKEYYTISEAENKQMFITEELAESIQKFRKKGESFVEIPFTKLKAIEDDNGNEIIRLFSMIIDNNELTKPLYDLQSLLDSKKGRPSESLPEIFQYFLDLSISAHIPCPSISNEIILKQLVRDKNNILKTCNFNDNDPDYQVLTIAIALEKNPSVITSLSSIALGRQLADIRTFEKESTSFLDPLFRV